MLLVSPDEWCALGLQVHVAVDICMSEGDSYDPMP